MQKLDDSTENESPAISPDDLLDQLATPSRLGHRPALERIRALLDGLDHPEKQIRIVHIGGTSGKGSTATMAAAILAEAGYRVGLHVKPHLESVEERFVVDQRQISSQRLVQLLQDAAPIARQMQPSWYELTVALAFEYFRQERVDIAVVEVGLGGTYDATNVIHPVSVALTNVDLDHTEILGDTVEKIAADKSGIIKPGVTVVSGAEQPTVREIVANRCRDVGAELWQIGREIQVTPLAIDRDGSTLALRTPRRHIPSMRLRPVGSHQILNAATAVGVVDAIRDDDIAASDDAVKRALADVSVPGRIEVVAHDPLVLLDGAHNPAKMASLAAALERLYPERSVTGILAFKRGHDIVATMAAIAPRLARVFLTRFDASTDYGPGQCVDPGELAALWRQVAPGREPIVEPDPTMALQLARGAADASALICVTGSLYLVGTLRALIRHSP